MVDENDKNEEKKGQVPPEEDRDKNAEGYPTYPAEEDIYGTEEEEQQIDPEDLDKKKRKEPPHTSEPEELEKLKQEKGLDVPGAELDDEDEDIGEEDEENNYYSLGGDKDMEDNRDNS